uniref:Leucine rich repeat containing 2 n=1 Tax=Petromyzon marinus TaxID=7757 RepID=S4R6R7_PETMA
KVMYTGVSQIRAMWESRISKQKVRQQREQERKARSAIERWGLPLSRLHQPARSRTRRGLQRRINPLASHLNHYNPLLQSFLTPQAAVPVQRLQLWLSSANTGDGDIWFMKSAMPSSNEDMVDLNELRVLNSRLHVLPRFVANFQRLQTLDLSKNCLQELPKEIGLLKGLQQLLLSYNQLRRIPEELGDCESLERLDLSSNNSLEELPYQLSSLKKLVLLDLSVNKFSSVPIAVLRMSGLQWLDMSKNRLHELPQDIDRLERVETMLLHHNSIRYLPLALSDMGELRTLVVSADHLVQVPTVLYKLPHLKILDMRENRLQEMRTTKQTSPPPLNKRLQVVDAEQEDMGKEFMTSYFQDLQKRETSPEYTTVVSLSLQL